MNRVGGIILFMFIASNISLTAQGKNFDFGIHSEFQFGKISQDNGNEDVVPFPASYKSTAVGIILKKRISKKSLLNLEPKLILSFYEISGPGSISLPAGFYLIERQTEVIIPIFYERPIRIAVKGRAPRCIAVNPNKNHHIYSTSKC